MARAIRPAGRGQGRLPERLIGESLYDSSELIGTANPRRASSNVPLIGESAPRPQQPMSSVDREQKRLLGRVVQPGIEGYENALRGLMSYGPQEHTVSKLVDPEPPEVPPIKGETKTWFDPSIIIPPDQRRTKNSTKKRT